MNKLKQLFIVSAGSVVLAAMPAGLNALDAGFEVTPAREFVRVDYSPQPAPVRNKDRFENATLPSGTVHALFDLDRPETGVFPTDRFTVRDRSHNTRRRVNLPYPDCAVRVSDCQDLAVINTLDGFGLQTRISIPFDGVIDPATVTNETVFVISLSSSLPSSDPGGRIIGINQIVWDSATLTLHVEVNDLLDQYRRYAVIVTRGVRDPSGAAVEASESFNQFRHDLNFGQTHDPEMKDYRKKLLDALQAARAAGIQESEIVTASVFTTQTITSVMERIRDQIKAGTPQPANFLLGPGGERAVFNRADVASITWRQHTTVSPSGFTPTGLDLASLDVVPNAVATIAYGTFLSPAYRHSEGYIPAVGTRSEVPPVQGYEEISFTLYLPAGPKPSTGWPVAIVGVPTARHIPVGAMAATLASHGIASIGIHTAGSAFGPLSTLTINLQNGSSLSVPDRGRSYDQNGDNRIGATEGSVAAPPRAWTVGERDGYRQTAIDLMQLVRVIEVGMDVDGDGSRDVDPGRIFHFGFSAGAMHGTIFLALEPSVTVAVENNPGGTVPEHSRWSPVRRPVLGMSLQARTPSLLNAPGITIIDGVPINAPHFNENKPLRNLPAVVNTIAGAIDIQKAFEIHEWAQESGQNPIVWAPYVRARPLAGLNAKSVIYQFAKTDQQAGNPGTTALLRAGNLADWTLHYRHDLAFAEVPTIPKNPHQVVISPTHQNATFRAVARGIQDQVARFFASGGTVVIHPEPARFFEVPVAGPLPENLNYIP